MTPREVVIQKHKRAMVWPCWWDRDMLTVLVPPINVECDIEWGDKLSGAFSTANEAWEDAANRIGQRGATDALCSGR